MIDRIWLTGFVCLLGWAPATRAQEKEGAARETKVETMREEQLPAYTVGSREAAADLLRQRVASVDWKDATFEEVLDWVKDQGEGRVNLVPKWGPLGIESITRENPINLQLNNTNIADVLNEVTAQLSEDGQVQYRAIGNKLTISTKQDFGRTLYVRVYDITDMLFQVPNFGQGAPQINLTQAGKTGGSGGGGGQSVFQGGGGQGQQQGSQGGPQEEQQNLLRLNQLRDLIEETIAPETWDTTGSPGGAAAGGGGRGRIRVTGHSLVVLNTIEVHEMIAGAFSFSE